MSRRYVEKIIHRSINRLGVERLDLVQYHWWDWGVPAGSTRRCISTSSGGRARSVAWG
jgi:aryl-alcohol dehydrogenase-like predicted oxidoreductase